MDDILDEGFTHKGELTKGEELEVRLLKTDAKFAFKELKIGRIALFVTSGLFVIGLILSANMELEDPFLINIEGVVFFLVIFFAALFVPKKPFVAMAVGVGFYFLNLAMSTLADPVSLMRGIIFKAILIYFLAKGVIGAKNYLEALRKLKSLGEDVAPEDKFKNA